MRSDSARHDADPAMTTNKPHAALMFAAGNGRGTGVFQKDIGTERDMLSAVQVLVERAASTSTSPTTRPDGDALCRTGVPTTLVRYLAAHARRSTIRTSRDTRRSDLALGIGATRTRRRPAAVSQQTAAPWRSHRAARRQAVKAVLKSALALAIAPSRVGLSRRRRRAAARRPAGPPAPRNLQVLPKDTSAADVVAQMQAVQRALGVQ